MNVATEEAPPCVWTLSSPNFFKAARSWHLSMRSVAADKAEGCQTPIDDDPSSTMQECLNMLARSVKGVTPFDDLLALKQVAPKVMSGGLTSCEPAWTMSAKPAASTNLRAACASGARLYFIFLPTTSGQP
eukprot:1242546-Amphidinium_carterae.1